MVAACVVALSYGVDGVQADAPDPKVQTTTGTIVTNADGSHTLTIRGQWQWTTHHGDCNQNGRAIGYAVDWFDPHQPGNHVTTLNGSSIDVGAASATKWNPADNLVHGTPPANDSTDPTQWSGGCGTYDPSLGYNTGTWGPISHTFDPTVAGPYRVCVVLYDVHAHKTSELTAGGSKRNTDNSSEKNVHTPLGNGCFQVTIAGGTTTTTPTTTTTTPTTTTSATTTTTAPTTTTTPATTTTPTTTTTPAPPRSYTGTPTISASPSPCPENPNQVSAGTSGAGSIHLVSVPPGV
ncbi:MAG: hypothetical protein JO186_05350 [Actinobacteria bacterium]|nr:hypothetical protein [Actinomycetota bacterium]MBV8396484.1 hypothetical protein [Actinomycetota bacterium]